MDPYKASHVSRPCCVLYIRGRWLSAVLAQKYSVCLECNDVLCNKTPEAIRMITVHFMHMYLCMYVCMYVCMCVYVCIYVCIHIHIRLYVCTCVCMHVYVSMFVCMHACMYAYACMVYVYMYVSTCMHVCMYVSIHIRMYRTVTFWLRDPVLAVYMYRRSGFKGLTNKKQMISTPSLNLYIIMHS